MPPKIDIDTKALSEFCRKHHIRKMWLFGSVLRDDFSDDSDVDVLYQFEDGHSVGWEIVTIGDQLSEIIGRRVDFIPEKYLKPRVRNHRMFQKQILFDDGYDAG